MEGADLLRYGNSSCRRKFYNTGNEKMSLEQTFFVKKSRQQSFSIIAKSILKLHLSHLTKKKN
jgi:hypothetical protein